MVKKGIRKVGGGCIDKRELSCVGGEVKEWRGYGEGAKGQMEHAQGYT